MGEKLVTILLWGLMTIVFLVKGEINFEHACIGMCMILLACELLYKEE